jgi:hypothetical protein
MLAGSALRSARLASSTRRPVLIRPGHGSGSLMPLPIPCALAAWCRSPLSASGRWSSRCSAERSPSGSSDFWFTATSGMGGTAPGSSPSLWSTGSCRALSWPASAAVRLMRCFSRVGPVLLAHGGAWARLEALDSLRWPLLEAPVIHGPAVAVRPVLGSGSANCPGQDPEGSGALAWRPLDPWEAESALWVLRRHGPALGAPELTGGSSLPALDRVAGACRLSRCAKSWR